jgi:PPOX class probable F420-dependent enzyme
MSPQVNSNAEAAVSDHTDELVAVITDRPLVAILGTRAANGDPHLTAVWYLSVNGQLLFATQKDSKKATHIRANPVAELCINAGPAGPCVTAHGIATIIGPMEPEFLLRLAERYLGLEGAQRYMATRDPDAVSVIVSIEPQRWRVWGSSNDLETQGPMTAASDDTGGDAMTNGRK